MAAAPAAARQLQARLGAFQRALNDQFDACRRAPADRRGPLLRHACTGVALLCHWQQHELQPVLAQAPDGLDSLHDLMTLSSRGDAQQRAVAALLEGLVQLQFAQIDASLAGADLPAAQCNDLDRAMAALLDGWLPQAAHRREAACVS